MKKNHERIVKRNGKNQIGSERYAVMRKISVEEKERILGRITKEAIENAHKMIAASGQNPEKYSPVIRECMAALIYGMLIAMSMENVGYYEWRWTEGVMAAIANSFYAMGKEESAALATYLYQSSDENSPEYNVNICQLVHIGIDAFYCLDQPEFLANGMQKVLDACHEDFGTGEEN